MELDALKPGNGAGHARWGDIDSVLDELKGRDDPEFMQEDSFLNLVKIYTGNAVYGGIGNALSTGKCNAIQAYLAAATSTMQKFGRKYAYAAVHKPVWRGVNFQKAAWADYAPGTIGMFPRYSSTTKSRDVASNFSRHGPAAAGTYDGRQCLFKIYLSKRNEPVTHVDLALGENPMDFSFYPSEEEVLLLPYFCF